MTDAQAAAPPVSSGPHHDGLFSHMAEGYAFCRMIFEGGQARDWVYLEVNPAFEVLTGLKGVTGKAVSAVLPGVRESDPALFEVYGRVARSRRPEKFETFVEALGTWFSVSAFSPQPDHFVAVFENITERKRLESTLGASELRHRQMFEANPQPMFAFDVETLRFLTVNDAAVAHYGYSRAEFLAMSIKDIRPPEDVPHLNMAIARADGTKGVDQSWARHRKKDGTLIDVEITSHPMVIDGRRARLVLPVDVTERQRSEMEYQALVRTSLDGFWIVDLSARILEVNASLCQMLGYTRTELLRMSIPDIEVAERPKDTAAHVQKVLQTGGDRFQTRHRRKDGAVIDVEVNAQYVPPLGDRIFAFFRDITERRRAEDALRSSEEKYRTFYGYRTRSRTFSTTWNPWPRTSPGYRRR